MNSFFTAELPEHNVHAAWRERKTTLRAQQLQDFNDSLYEVVADRILARRDSIYNALIHALNTATDPNGCSVDLWTYNVAHYHSNGSFPDEMEVRLRSKGYHWLVGRVDHGFDASTVSCENWDDEGRYTGEWTSAWPTYPQSVHEVVRFTDFRNRIALLFGDDRYRVSYTVVAEKTLTRPVTVLVQKIALRLHYHPRGLFPRARDALLRTKAKYESYSSTTPWYMPYVWTGTPGIRETDEEEQVRPAEPPGFSNRTPPQPPSPIGEPPPLARRTNGGGLKPEDSPNPARRLSFSGIHEYTGEDALERCARDAVAEWAAEARGELKPACHCEYHHSETE